MTELGSDQAAQRPRRKTRRFTIEQRQQMVAESFAAGASVREVAARHGVHANQLSTWRTESAKKKTSATTAKTMRFAAVRTAPTVSDGVIEMDLTSSCIRVRGEVSAAMLREVLGLMR
jgi:transposase-like protein